MTKHIPLTKGATARVDEADYARLLTMGKWSLSSKGYAVHWCKDTSGKRKSRYMHRIILSAPPHLVVDHIDHNRLNNVRSNLRLATRSENNAHRRKASSNTLGYKGINRSRDKFEARVKYYGKRIYLGCFADAEDAARAYDVAVQLLYKDFAMPNFPDAKASSELTDHILERLARYDLPEN